MITFRRRGTEATRAEDILAGFYNSNEEEETDSLNGTASIPKARNIIKVEDPGFLLQVNIFSGISKFTSCRGSEFSFICSNAGLWVGVFVCTRPQDQPKNYKDRKFGSHTSLEHI